MGFHSAQRKYNAAPQSLNTISHLKVTSFKLCFQSDVAWEVCVKLVAGFWNMISVFSSQPDLKRKREYLIFAKVAILFEIV